MNSYVDRYTVVHRTEWIKSNLNPTWQPFTVSVRALCNGELYRYLKFYSMPIVALLFLANKFSLSLSLSLSFFLIIFTHADDSSESKAFSRVCV